MPHHICLIPGDGIGPEIMASTKSVLQALNLDCQFTEVQAGLNALETTGQLLPEETLSSIIKADCTLKGPLTTPIGKGFSSINVALRKHFDLYANIRPVVSIPGTKSRYDNLDIITVRENTEGAYLTDHQTLSEDGEYAESKIQISRQGSERVIEHAFKLAASLNRKKITLVHKANILKTTSGLFLDIGREVAAQYPDIIFEEMIVDNTCMQLVMRPEQFDVIVTTNLFGDILSDLCAGLVGGLGMAPGANIGEKTAIFEAVHGSAPDIAGQGLANPTALILASCLMLDQLGEHQASQRVRQAIFSTLAQAENRTGDLGGSASTASFTQALIQNL